LQCLFIFHPKINILPCPIRRRPRERECTKEEEEHKAEKADLHLTRLISGALGFKN
jgi:hypothetical protein